MRKLALVQVTRLPRIDYGCPEGDPILGLYRVSAPVLDFYALSDGTLLLLAFNDPLVVRTRPDLSSPYVDESDELLWFDADIFARWVEECQQEAYDFAEYYSNAADGLEDPIIIYHALPTFETTDTAWRCGSSGRSARRRRDYRLPLQQAPET